MVNVVTKVVGAGKDALESVGNRVSGAKSFGVSLLKWAAQGLAVVLSLALLVPLLKNLPFVNRLDKYGAAVVGFVMMLAAGLLAMLKYGVTKFLAAGLGLAGAISVLSAVVLPLIEKAVQSTKEVLA